MTLGELAQWLVIGITILAISSWGSFVVLILILRLLGNICAGMSSTNASLIEVIDLVRWMAGADREEDASTTETDANEAATATMDRLRDDVPHGSTRGASRDRVPGVRETGRHARPARSAQ